MSTDLIYVSSVIAILLILFTRLLLKSLGHFKYESKEKQNEYADWLCREGTPKMYTAIVVNGAGVKYCNSIASMSIIFHEQSVHLIGKTGIEFFDFKDSEDSKYCEWLIGCAPDSLCVFKVSTGRQKTVR